MTNREITITVQGVDNASHVVERITKTVGGMSDNLEAANRAISFDTILQGMDRVGRGASGLYDAMDGLVQASFNSAISVRAVFGESGEQLTEFAKTADQTVGLSEKAFNKLITPIGSVLKNIIGLNDADAAKWAIELTERASDLAFVYDTDVTSALQAVTSGIQGQMRPLTQYGIGLNAAMVEARALADTGKESADSLTLQDKAMARLSLIMEQTSGHAGIFADNQDLLFNKQQSLNASMENQRAIIGERLLPVQDKLIDGFRSLPQEMQLGIIAFREFGGPTLEVVKGLGQIGVGLQGLPTTISAVKDAFGGLSRIGADLAPVALGVTGVVTAAMALNRAIEGDGLPKWAAGLSAIHDPAEQLEYAIAQLEGRTDKLSVAELNLLRQLHETNEGHKLAAAHLEEQERATQELTSATENAAEPTVTWASLLDELNEQLEAASGNAIEAFEAISKWEKVPTREIIELDLAIRDVDRDIRALEIAQRSGIEINEEQLEALKNTKQSYEDQKQVLQDQTGAVVDSTIRTGLQNDAFNDLILTQEDVQEATRNSISPFIDLSNTLKNDVETSFMDVLEQMEVINTTPTSVQIDTEDVAIAEDDMRNLATYVGGDFANTFEQIDVKLGENLASLRGHFSSFFNATLEQNRTWHESFDNEFTVTWGDITRNTVSAWESISSTIGSNLDSIDSKLSENLGGLRGHLTSFFTASLEQNRAWGVEFDNAFDLTWSNIKSNTASTWETLYSTVDRGLRSMDSRLKEIGPDILAGVLWPYERARDAIGGIGSAFERNIKSPFNNVVSALNKFTTGFKGAVNWIGGRLNLGEIIKGSYTIPGLARGGIFQQSGLAITGEHGPELALWPKGAQVMPHERSVDFLKALSPEAAIGGIPGVDFVKDIMSGLGGAIKSGLAEFVRLGTGPIIDMAFRAVGLGTPNLLFDGFGAAIFKTMKDGLWNIVDEWIRGVKESTMGTGILGRPLQGYTITQEFGMSPFAWAGAYGGNAHSGIDLAAPQGTPISAADTGRVTMAGWNGGYGNYVSILHNGLLTAYAHMQRITTALNNIVTKGEQIGTVGSTGYSTGPHLHFEVLDNGVLQNPRKYVQFKNGTPRIPEDMFAFLHRNEAVLPASLNPFVSMGFHGMHAGGNMRAAPSVVINIENVQAQSEEEVRDLSSTLAWSYVNAIDFRNGVRLQ